MVTIDEVIELLQEQKWTPRIRPSFRQSIVEAQRREGEHVRTRYIATEKRLLKMTKDEVLAKLNRPPKQGQ